MSFFLGIDIGSTAVKACLIRGGDMPSVAGRGSSAYPTFRDGPLAEQDPLDWNRAAADAVRQAVAGLSEAEKKKIGGICLSAQGGSIFAANEKGEPLTPAYTWMDRRAESESEEFAAACGREKVRGICGWGPSPADCVSKILWIRRNQPDVYSRARRYYTTEESVTGYLTGSFVTDATGESICRLWDYLSGEYWSPALDFAGIDSSFLPEVRPCGSPAGLLRPEAAADMTLPAGIPVYTGAHDQYCASIGSGVTEPGQLLIATGTAWVIFGVSDRPLSGPPFPAPCRHPVDGRFGVMTSMSGCGGAIGAFAESRGTTPRGFDEETEKRGVREVRESLADFFVCPLPPGQSIPHREGVCLPLSPVSGRSDADVALAAMEAVAFESAILIDAFEKAGFPHGDEIVMSGGASKSPLWRGIVAAVLPDRRVCRLCEADAPALGAAILAGWGSGAFASLGEASSLFSARLPVDADPDAAEFYKKKYQAYRSWALA